MTAEPTEPRAATFGPMVHRFGHRRPDEWDIPFTNWTTLTATDAEGREHIFEVPTAALDAARKASPPLDVAVAVVIHRWRHPTKLLDGCPCFTDAGVAVEIAVAEGLVSLDPTP